MKIISIVYPEPIPNYSDDILKLLEEIRIALHSKEDCAEVY